MRYAVTVEDATFSCQYPIVTSLCDSGLSCLAFSSYSKLLGERSGGSEASP